jgi:queuosine precursor transporter
MENNKWLWALLYLISIVFANIIVSWLGIIKIGILSFPAGVVLIGLTFSFRDMLQRTWGNWPCWYWMFLASIITTLFNWQLAFASLSAFLVSESIDWFVFKILKVPLRKRIMIANLFAVPLDSLIFVYLAFGWLPEAIIGQSIIKYLSGLLVLPFIWKRK